MTVNKVQGVMNGESTGVGIRVIVNGAWGFAATNELSQAGVVRAAQQAAAIAKANAKFKPCWCNWRKRRYGEVA
ncbi:MAG: DNA gyrase modulator [Lysobacterales bacterium]